MNWAARIFICAVFIDLFCKRGLVTKIEGESDNFR